METKEKDWNVHSKWIEFFYLIYSKKAPRRGYSQKKRSSKASVFQENIPWQVLIIIME